MEDFLKLIKTRQSTRGPFDTKKSISKEDLNKILEAGRWAPTPHNMQNFEIIVVDDKKILDGIGNIKFTIPRAGIEENNNFMSSSEEELQRKKTGILNRMPTSMTEQNINPEDFRRDYMRKLITATSTLLVVSYDPNKRAPGSEGDFLGKIGLGCLMENIWLMANSLGIGMHIFSAVSYSDDLEKQMKDILHIPESLKLAFACRLGYPASIEGNYIRVRRDIEEFTYFNQYGNKSENK